MLSAEKIQSNWERYVTEIKTNISKERTDILIPLPLYSEVLDAFNNNDENYYEKLYYLIDRFIPGGISKDDFKDKYDKSDVKWKMGNYYSLELIERFEDNKPEPANELMSDIIRYARSSTSDSSKFAKIS